jgi:uncharacterized membrane protein YagU involved in acid resistance
MVGLVAGAAATAVTDRVEVLVGRLTPRSKQLKEPEIPEGSSSGSAARMVLDSLGQTPRQETLRATKTIIHYGLGVGWGPLYCLLRRRSTLSPLAAGAAAGAALSLVIDELANGVLGITPPPQEFPASAHLRGLMTHLAWGITAAAVAETSFRLLRDDRSASSRVPVRARVLHEPSAHQDGGRQR